MDSVCGSVPKNSQRPLCSLAEVHLNPIDNGNQSLLVSPISKSKQVPYPVASSPIPADQTSLQGQLPYDLLQPDLPDVVGTRKGCLHQVTKLCQSCQPSTPAQSEHGDTIQDTSSLISSAQIPVCDPVPRPNVQHLEPSAAKEDVNPDAFTEATYVLQPMSSGDVYWKAMGLDYICSQVTLSCVMEPTSILIQSQVTSPGRDNFNWMPMNLVESLVSMGTGKQSVCQPYPEYSRVHTRWFLIPWGYYSFESSSGQDQFNLDDCSGLIGQGQSHTLNNHFDLRNQE